MGKLLNFPKAAKTVNSDGSRRGTFIENMSGQYEVLSIKKAPVGPLVQIARLRQVNVENAPPFEILLSRTSYHSRTPCVGEKIWLTKMTHADCVTYTTS